jgi:hypothetical protein
MIRIASIVLLGASLVALPVANTEAQAQTEQTLADIADEAIIILTWSKLGIDVFPQSQSDWELRGANERWLWAIQDAKGTDGSGSPRFWSRLEFAQTNDAGAKSSLDLMELDCIGWRTRSLSRNDYAQYNLKGEILYRSDIAGPWAYIPPGRALNTVAELKCP